MRRSAAVSGIFLDNVAEWLTQSALNGSNLESIIRGFCERIFAAGLPVARVHLSFSMLHPLYDALGFTWRRSNGLTIEGYRYKSSERPDRFLQSPYFYLLENNLQHLRRRLSDEGGSEFPVYKELREEGITDYIAFAQTFGEDSEQGMMGSWSTAHSDGFSEDMIDALLRIQSSLAVAAKMAVLGKLASNMLTTYLGADAGNRVLNGHIRRGDGETVRAALVMGDLRQSTMFADKGGRQAYIQTLNEFFEAIATPFNQNGGQILSFIGDGFLAVYPCTRHREPSEAACKAALSAAHEAQRRIGALNNSRKGRKLAPLRYGIGLHVGNVMYGNVGLKDRLTFSAFGSAVNEVQRLQALTKKFGREVIASEAFTAYSGGRWTPLGEERLRGIRQKLNILHLATSETDTEVDQVLTESFTESFSEAEQVILLHRDVKTKLDKHVSKQKA